MLAATEAPIKLWQLYKCTNFRKDNSNGGGLNEAVNENQNDKFELVKMTWLAESDMVINEFVCT